MISIQNMFPPFPILFSKMKTRENIHLDRENSHRREYKGILKGVKITAKKEKNKHTTTEYPKESIKNT